MKLIFKNILSYFIIGIVLLFFNSEKIFCQPKEIFGYSGNIGSHFYDIHNINQTLKNASCNTLDEFSIFIGLSIYFNNNFLFYLPKDTVSHHNNISRSGFDLLHSFSYYSNLSPGFFNGTGFGYNIFEYDILLNFDLAKFFTLIPSFGIFLSWGKLTIADSVPSYNNFKNDLLHPPLINEFAFNRVGLKIGLGFYLNMGVMEEKVDDKIIHHIFRIGGFIHYLFPMYSSSDANYYFQSVGGNPVSGLGSNFPNGFMLEFKMSLEKETSYK